MRWNNIDIIQTIYSNLNISLFDQPIKNRNNLDEVIPVLSDHQITLLQIGQPYIFQSVLPQRKHSFQYHSSKPEI